MSAGRALNFSTKVVWQQQRRSVTLFTSSSFFPRRTVLEIKGRSNRSIQKAQISTGSRLHMTHLPTSAIVDTTGKSDWTKEAVEQIPSRTLNTPADPLRILVLYGSLRKVSYSKLLALEFTRLLSHLGADVRVFDPAGLPLKDETSTDHAKVQELRDLAIWSEGMVWVSPEQHGSMTAVFKNQIDWIPLSLGSVRPTQGRTLALAQVNGGSQSFNCLNQLRILGRWMRCFTIPNQSSVPKAWQQFDGDGRLKDTGFRERVVDVAEELWKVTYLMRPVRDVLDDRYSERKEKAEKGRLQSQAEKEAEKTKSKELNEPDVGGDKLAKP